MLGGPQPIILLPGSPVSSAGTSGRCIHTAQRLKGRQSSRVQYVARAHAGAPVWFCAPRPMLGLFHPHCSWGGHLYADSMGTSNSVGNHLLLCHSERGIHLLRSAATDGRRCYPWVGQMMRLLSVASLVLGLGFLRGCRDGPLWPHCQNHSTSAEPWECTPLTGMQPCEHKGQRHNSTSYVQRPSVRRHPK
ncbi:hypothetical protein BKA80DRAFT_264976 [Phyllosticta citrichinensis]